MKTFKQFFEDTSITSIDIADGKLGNEVAKRKSPSLNNITKKKKKRKITRVRPSK